MTYDPSLHLFCHPWELQTVVHMRRTWNRPARVQMAPVLAPTEPWEGTSVATWGTAHYDPTTELFKLWYEAWNPDRPRAAGHAGLLRHLNRRRDLGQARSGAVRVGRQSLE